MLLFTLSMPTANSQSGKKASHQIFGASDCGQWLAEKTPAREVWLMGYLSGMSTMHDAIGHTVKDPLSIIQSANQAYIWMDNWCKANPLENLVSGGQKLWIELMEKAAKQNKK